MKDGDFTDQTLINRALLFAAHYFNTTCRNFGKPVYLHSLRVAQHAHALGYDDTTLVCAVLHDLLEDTGCTAAEIEAEFGADVAACVQALTFNDAISDKLLKNTLSIDACAKFGATALVIKCLDTMDNMDYFALAKDDDKAYLLKKYAHLKAVCEIHIPDAPAFTAFCGKLSALLETII